VAVRRRVRVTDDRRPLGRHMPVILGDTLCCDPLSWFERGQLVLNPSVFVLDLGPSIWWRNHTDPTMTALTAPDGTLRRMQHRRACTATSATCADTRLA